MCVELQMFTKKMLLSKLTIFFIYLLNVFLFFYRLHTPSLTNESAKCLLFKDMQNNYFFNDVHWIKDPL